MASYLLLICAALAAGLINSVAGGGMFFTFPALVFTGVPSIIANASSTAALMPGTYASSWAYREYFRKSEHFPFVPMLLASIGGGAIGALLLLLTPQKTFDFVIPWLMLAASLLFAFGPRIAPFLKRVFHIGPVTLVLAQIAVGIYGGYFGGAVGIIMLALWSVFGITDIHFMNANRTLMGSVANSIAVVLFIIAHKIWWPQTLAMLAAAVLGGYIGARSAKKINQRYLRTLIIVVSFGITTAFFLRH